MTRALAEKIDAQSGKRFIETLPVVTAAAATVFPSLEPSICLYASVRNCRGVDKLDSN